MSRSVRDLRELICLSRFGFRSDENPSEEEQQQQSTDSILFYFDPSILNNWLEMTSSRLENLRLLSPNTLINLFYFWLKQFDYEHKQSLFRMEIELFSEHLIFAFTPNNLDSEQINRFARDILHDIQKQIEKNSSKENDYEYLLSIDIFNRYKRDDQYRNLLANLPENLTKNNTNRLHLQWMLAIRAFGLVAICTAGVEFFEKIHKTLEKNRSTVDIYQSDIPDPDPTNQIRNRILIALRKGYIEVIEYFIKTKQLTGESLDDQNRNILFHALPLENTAMIEYLIKSNLPNLDINSVAQSGNSLLHLCVTLQRLDFLQLIHQTYPNVDLNQYNQQQATPLHLAIIYNNLPIIEYLIQSGANRTLLIRNKTYLQLAEELQEKTIIDFFSKIS